MIIEIIGQRAIKADGNVTVTYTDGRTVVYTERTERLILNANCISCIVTNEKEKQVI